MRRTGVLVVLAVLMMAVVSAQDGVPAPTTPTRYALEAGYYSADAAAIARLFTDDADVVIDGMRATGRRQIYALYRTQLATRTLLVLSPRKLQASGDLAIESGVTLTRLAALRFGNATPARNGRYLMALTSVDGEWRISSLMIQNDVPLGTENTSDRQWRHPRIGGSRTHPRNRPSRRSRSSPRPAKTAQGMRSCDVPSAPMHRTTENPRNEPLWYRH